MKTPFKRSLRAWAFWGVALVLIALDWRGSIAHDRFAEPPPLALGNGPAPDAGHCSLAPSAVTPR